MRHCFILAFTAGLGLLLQAAESPANTLTDDEKKAGWVLLFDGKSLDHWRDPTKLDPPSDSWALEDGSIKALAHPHINEDLFSEDTYRDFEFQWDWRISQGGNSGIKYRIQRTVWIAGEHPAIPRFEDEVEWFLDHPVTTRPQRGQDYVIGFEYQMLDDERHADARAGKTHTTGALYDIAAPSRDATKPAGEWNHSVLKLQGDHVEHWLNGVKVVDASVAPADVKPKLEHRWGKTPGVLHLLGDQPERECPISLQNHGNDAWFRNLKIRRL